MHNKDTLKWSVSKTCMQVRKDIKDNSNFCLTKHFTMKHWQKWTMRSYEEDRQNLTDEGGIMLDNEEIITLSVSVASQPGTDSSCRTMSTCPCSQAHMSAVEPSSSRRFTWAPQDSRALTMSPLPWLTASISAVCPAYNTHTPISITHRLTHAEVHWGTRRGRTWLALALTSPVRCSCRTVWRSLSELKAARAVNMIAV